MATSNKTLFIFRAGEALASVAERRGQYPDIIRAAIGDAWPFAFGVHDARTDAPFPDVESMAGVIITGSSSSVTEQAPWMKRAGAFLRRASEEGVPVLGLCFGHQLLADAFGGKVERNPRGREIGTVAMTLEEEAARDLLFSGCARTFAIQATHVDSVVALPAGARRLASTSLDPNASYAIGDRVRCVQLHPEFDADIVRSYVEARVEIIDSEGLSAKDILANVEESPDARKLLTNFAAHFARR